MGKRMLKREAFKYLMTKLASLIEVDRYPKVGNPNIYWYHFGLKGITLPVLLEVFRALSVQTPRSLNDILELSLTFPSSPCLEMSDIILNGKLFPVFRSYIKAVQENSFYKAKYTKMDAIHIALCYKCCRTRA
eukprot:Lankesteria_metandrocarpae@DN5262_c0_g2_i3.p1